MDWRLKFSEKVEEEEKKCTPSTRGQGFKKKCFRIENMKIHADECRRHWQVATAKDVESGVWHINNLDEIPDDEFFVLWIKRP